MINLKNDIFWSWKTKKDIMWFIYYFVSGVLTYIIFKTSIIKILLFVFSFELIYYALYHKFYDFIKRYVLNIFYVTAYVVTAVIYDANKKK